MKKFSVWNVCGLLRELCRYFFNPRIKKPDSAAAIGFLERCF